MSKSGARLAIFAALIGFRGNLMALRSDLLSVAKTAGC